jgi:hypothetical protein
VVLVFLCSVRRLLVTASVVPSSPIFVTLMKEALSSPKRRFLQEPHGVTSQKTPFFIVTTVKTSNLTKTKQIPWLLVRKRTIPTERPPLVNEI